MEKLAHVSEATAGKLVELQPGESSLNGPVVNEDVWHGLDKAFKYKCSQPHWGEKRKKRHEKREERS